MKNLFKGCFFIGGVCLVALLVFFSVSLIGNSPIEETDNQTIETDTQTTDNEQTDDTDDEQTETEDIPKENKSSGGGSSSGGGGLFESPNLPSYIPQTIGGLSCVTLSTGKKACLIAKNISLEDLQTLLN